MLGTGKAAVALTDAVASGEHLKFVEIEAYTKGEAPRLVDEFKFEDVIVSSLQTSGSAS